MAADGFTDDFFRTPAGVDVGAVVKLNALIPGLVDDTQRIFGVGLFAKHHGAQVKALTLSRTVPVCGKSWRTPQKRRQFHSIPESKALEQADVGGSVPLS